MLNQIILFFPQISRPSIAQAGEGATTLKEAVPILENITKLHTDYAMCFGKQCMYILPALGVLTLHNKI